MADVVTVVTLMGSRRSDPGPWSGACRTVAARTTPIGGIQAPTPGRLRTGCDDGEEGRHFGCGAHSRTQ